MPILSYFLVTGAALMSLLFAASAMLPQRPVEAIEKVAVQTKAPAPTRPAPARQAPPEPQILSQQIAPEPDMSSDLVRLAQPAGTPLATKPAAVAEQPAKPAPRQETAHKVTKPRRTVTHRDDYRNHYARANRDEYRQAFGFSRPPRDRGFGWGDPFGSRF